MAGKSKIEWCTDTWNPIVGCSVVSPGCTNCYAMAMAARLERMLPDREVRGLDGSFPNLYSGLTQPSKAGPVWTGKVALQESVLTKPISWTRPRRIFVNSMGDLFHEDVPDAWIDYVFAVMALAPQHSFQVLTKRSARMRLWARDTETPFRIADAKNALGAGSFVWPLANVWLGVSAEDQRRADERIPDLLATPAAVRWVSAEPLLGPIDFTNHDPTGIQTKMGAHGWSSIWKNNGIGRSWLDWIVVGGESGPGARPMHPDWARSIRDQCEAAGVAFLFKQWGEWGTGSYLIGSGTPIFRRFHSFQEWVNKARTRVNAGICLDSDGNRLRIGEDFMRARDEGKFPVTILDRVGKHAAGRLLDGVEHNGYPIALQAVS